MFRSNGLCPSKSGDIYSIFWRVVSCCLRIPEVTQELYRSTQHTLLKTSSVLGASQVVLVVKNPPANAEDTGDTGSDTGSIPGSGKFHGGGNGNSLQYSCLENPMGRGAWWATSMGLHRVWQDWVSTTTFPGTLCGMLGGDKEQIVKFPPSLFH